MKSIILSLLWLTLAASFFFHFETKTVTATIVYYALVIIPVGYAIFDVSGYYFQCTRNPSAGGGFFIAIGLFVAFGVILYLMPIEKRLSAVLLLWIIRVSSTKLPEGIPGALLELFIPFNWRNFIQLSKSVDGKGNSGKLETRISYQLKRIFHALSPFHKPAW